MGQTKFAFFEGEIVPIEQAKISIMTHAFNYGTGVFAGIRGYWNQDEEEMYIVHLKKHYERFQRSCKLMMINLPYSVDDFFQITLELLRKEGFREDTYIRPLAYKSTPQIGVRLHNLEDAFALFATPFGSYIGNEEAAKAGVSSWIRLPDNAIPARGKITGAYVNSAFIKTEAALNGFDEAIVLTRDGHVSEGSAENLFIVREGILVTPPISDDILEGITRASIIELAKNELGREVQERHIDRSELYVAEEAFYCGTGVQIVAITEIDHRPVGEGKIGPVAAQLREIYFNIVRGRNKKYSHWVTPVYASAKATLEKAPVAAT
ncbi:MAG: branched-chain amino acid transaminase [Chloroflexi bacterium]|nr:branched-chain amino acid transaminase [Chloroflexota bacterium]